MCTYKNWQLSAHTYISMQYMYILVKHFVHKKVNFIYTSIIMLVDRKIALYGIE